MGGLRLNSEGISCHAWSPDRSSLAVCFNSEVVSIFSNVTSGKFSEWKLEHSLVGHDLLVTAIDWSPVHNKIVTCSHDRNAFVWTLTTPSDSGEEKWKPSLSILRINRAALDVKWSPDGTKFAVASGAKVVPVCHYELSNDWWISKMIKKHKSTVTSVSWHPNSQLLLTGSCDFKCRVFSAFNKEIDTACPGPFGDTSTKPFGELLMEFGQSNGWVEDVAWSPSGDRGAFIGHDSSISFVTLGESPTCRVIKTKGLPFQKVLFLSDTIVVAGGHDFNPEVFQLDDSTDDWTSLGHVDQKGSGGIKKKAASAFQAVQQKWNNKADRGQDSNDGADDLWTIHHNSITDMKLFGSGGSFSTTGLDGRLSTWTESDLKKVSGLKL